VRDTLNLIHELAERGVGVRNLADPIWVDSSNPADPMAQLAVVLFGQMERTYTLERAAHAPGRRDRQRPPGSETPRGVAVTPRSPDIFPGGSYGTPSRKHPLRPAAFPQEVPLARS